jgi:hypothetical protein
MIEHSIVVLIAFPGTVSYSPAHPAMNIGATGGLIVVAPRKGRGAILQICWNTPRGIPAQLSSTMDLGLRTAAE